MIQTFKTIPLPVGGVILSWLVVLFECFGGCVVLIDASNALVLSVEGHSACICLPMAAIKEEL